MDRLHDGVAGAAVSARSSALILRMAFTISGGWSRCASFGMASQTAFAMHRQSAVKVPVSSKSMNLTVRPGLLPVLSK